MFRVLSWVLFFQLIKETTILGLCLYKDLALVPYGCSYTDNGQVVLHYVNLMA